MELNCHTGNSFQQEESIAKPMLRGKWHIARHPAQWGRAWLSRHSSGLDAELHHST